MQNQLHNNPLADSERQEFENEIQRLQRANDMLLLRMRRDEQEKREFGMQIQLIMDRARVIEQRQRDMVEFLARLVKRPECASMFIRLSEKHNKKRRLSGSNVYCGKEDSFKFDGLLTMHTENVDPFSSDSSNWQIIKELNTSFSYWENILYSIGQEMGEATLCPLTHQEIPGSYADSDTDDDTCSPILCPSSPRSAEIAQPASPAIFFNLGLDSQLKASVKDGNTKLASPASSSKKNNISLPIGKNDIFWEQYLTENPILNTTQEAESKRRDVHDVKIDRRSSDPIGFWCKTNNLENITEQMGNLTPRERI